MLIKRALFASKILNFSIWERIFLFNLLRKNLVYLTLEAVPQFNILVCGTYQSGKTTLIKSLWGIDIIPNLYTDKDRILYLYSPSSLKKQFVYLKNSGASNVPIDMLVQKKLDHWSHYIGFYDSTGFGYRDRDDSVFIEKINQFPLHAVMLVLHPNHEESFAEDKLLKFLSYYQTKTNIPIFSVLNAIDLKQTRYSQPIHQELKRIKLRLEKIYSLKIKAISGVSAYNSWLAKMILFKKNESFFEEIKEDLERCITRCDEYSNNPAKSLLKRSCIEDLDLQFDDFCKQNFLFKASYIFLNQLLVSLRNNGINVYDFQKRLNDIKHLN